MPVLHRNVCATALEGDAGLDHHDAGGAAGADAGVRIRRAAGDAAEVQVVDIEVRVAELFGVGQVLRGGADLEPDPFGDGDVFDQVYVEAESTGSGDDALARGAHHAWGGVHQDRRAADGYGAKSRERTEASREIANGRIN